MTTTTSTASATGSSAIAHCQQNANYVTPPEHYVYVHHVECLRDGGILDPDDQLFDVFDENKDQILAIYDEPNDVVPGSTQPYASHFAVNGTASSTSSSGTGKSITSVESPLDGKVNIISSSGDGDVVEITNIAEPPTDGLRVISDNTHTLQQMPSSSSAITGSGSASPLTTAPRPHPHFEQKRAGVSNTNRIFHSALKNVDGSPRSKHRVTISPDADRQALIEESSSFAKEAVMVRTSARKSRLTDSFFDAKERLEEKLAASSMENRVTKADAKISKLIPPMEAANRGQTVIVLSDGTVNMPLGIEISPVCDPANTIRLQAVEIRQIDDEGRVGADGRLRIGDHIVEINQRPVYQMSISRARAYLHELQAVTHPSLTIDRPIETFSCDAVSHRSQSSTSSLQKRPIQSALQQANTTALGATFPVEIVKKSGGFGFTITSRETAKGERLFYIGTVKTDGAAVNKLRAGDRLLQINDENTAELGQNDMVERLKRIKVGDSVKLLVSRLGSQENENQNSAPQKYVDGSCKERANEEAERCSEKGQENGKEEILTMDIALNETGSAGLGVSLKARAVMKPDGTRHDCGIFIKKVLHGGAAYKDGRLQVNDQLIEIEDIDLRSMKKNSEASDAITRCLKNIGPNGTSVRLRVARNLELLHDNDQSGVRSSVDESPILNRDSSMVHNGSRTKAGDGDVAIVAKQFPPSDSISRRRISSLGERSLNANEDLESIASDRQKCVSEDEVSHIDVDAFSRENPARRSISEKRHMGAANDANSTMLFQKIKHNRQMSAPVLQRFSPFVSPPQQSVLTSSRSATSLRERCRRRSLAFFRVSGGSKAKSVIGMSTGGREKIIATSPSGLSINNSSNEGLKEALSPSSPNRRSLSLESMEAHKLLTPTTASAHPSEPALRDAVRVEQAARRGHPNALKRAQRSRPNGHTQPSASDAEDGATTAEKGLHEPYASLPREVSASSKEKQQRRKSVGSSLFSKISQRLGGSRSRDASPEKAVSFDVSERNNANAEQNGMQDHRDWNKQGSQMARRPPPPYKPPAYDIRQAVNPDYYANDMSGTHKIEIVCNGEEIPAGGCLRVANSKFYNSFVERSKDRPKTEFLTGRGSGRLPATTKKVAKVKNEAHTSIGIKQQQHTELSSMHSPVNSSSIQSSRSTTSKDSRSNISKTAAQDAVPTTTVPSTPGLHTAQPPQTEMRRLAQEEEAATRPHTLTFPQQQQQSQLERQHSKSTMKDSGHVQHSSPQQYERGTASKGPVPTMQPATRPVPVVFPTSRTFFVAPSSRMSGRRANSSQGGARLSSRNRAKSLSSRSPKEHLAVESSAGQQPKNLPKPETVTFSRAPSHLNQQQSPRNPSCCESHFHQPQQQKQSPGTPDSFALPPPLPKTSTPSTPYTPSDFDGTTLSSPAYLQTLLESPARSARNDDVARASKPIRYIKIHYGPSHPQALKQQSLRTRSVDVPSPDPYPFQQQQQTQQQQQSTDEFDYRKYLRLTRRDRVNEQEKRVTLIAAVPGETTFLRGTATRYAQPRRPNTLYSATSS